MFRLSRDWGVWIFPLREMKGRAIRRFEGMIYMEENKYEFTLKMPLSWLGTIEAAMERLIRYRAEESDEVTDEARILTLLEDTGRERD
jgi:hypothetical protein